ncbi:AAA family ATPase [Epidermidibacterium keratini]|uniref:AAA family ATPase n=1 Tax=Epidermidibacterium keratini TaxID=1891644 RepID=A0A7L4YR39_9ACTN|nr:ParA family protein [Epidermidibacterium keratini]QHC01590.1 AAA family ATPase [Epidermidibacterium keratini]
MGRGTAAGTVCFAVANQKGGVAKTTSSISLGVALSDLGYRVLLVDLDPQACMTFSLGLDPDQLERSVHDVLVGDAEAAEVVSATEDGPDLLPATIDLASAEALLLTRTGREYALRNALEDLLEQQAAAGTPYDFVILDCPPSLGVLTINGLTAAAEVIVPLQCETLSHRGVGQLLETIADVRKMTNRGLQVRGILPTMFDARTTHSRDVLDDVAMRYELPVLEPPIARSIRFAEAPAAGRSILRTARRTRGAQAYADHAKSLAGEREAAS